MEIVMAATSSYSEILAINEPLVHKYANRHNLGFNFVKIPDDYERPFSWFKIEVLMYELMYEDYVLWLDADTLIINQEFDINSILEIDKLLYVAEDINGMNCGVMMWKGCTASIDFLKQVWTKTEYLNHIWWEQAAIHELVKDNYGDIKSRIKYMPQNIWNAYDYTTLGLPGTQPGQADRSSFVMHFPAMSVTRRINHMKKYNELFNS